MTRLSRRLPTVLLWVAPCIVPALGAGSETAPPEVVAALVTDQDHMAEWVRGVRGQTEKHGYLDISLHLAREIYPNLDDQAIQREKAYFRALGEQLDGFVKDARSARERIEQVNEFLFDILKLRSDAVGLGQKEKPDHYFPHAVLKHRRGVCLGLSLIYLELCEHARIPVYPMHAPQHIFIRYDDGDEIFDIEATERGGFFKSEERYAHYQNPECLGERPLVYRIGKVEVMADLLNAAAWCASIGTTEKELAEERGVLMGKLCVALGPEIFNNWDTLAEAQYKGRRRLEALASFEKALALRPVVSGVYNQEYWRKREERFREGAEAASKR